MTYQQHHRLKKPSLRRIFNESCMVT